MSSICARCGEEHLTPRGFPACVSHKRKTGAACRANPVSGTTLCSKHGGMSPRTRRKGAQRVAEAKIAKTIGDLMREHDRPDEHPFVALLDANRRLAAMTRSLEQLVSEYRASGHDEQLQVAVGMYERIARLSTQVSKTALDANLEDRLVRVEEQKIEVLYAVTLAGLRAIRATPEQESVFRKTVAAEIRAYDEGRKPLPAVPERNPAYRPPHIART